MSMVLYNGKTPVAQPSFSPARRRLHDRPFSQPLYMAPVIRREKTLTPKSSAM